MNLKEKLLLLRTKLFIFAMTRSLNKNALFKKIEFLFRTHILSLICEQKDHLWAVKVEWAGTKAGKHRTCSRCLKSEKYQSIFSNKIV